MGGLWLLAGLWLLGDGPFDGLAGPPPVQRSVQETTVQETSVQETSTRRERLVGEGIEPVRIEASSQMGKRFRLTDAFFMVDGAQIAHMTAPPKQALDLSSRVLDLNLGGGQHALTVVLVFQGRNGGLFSYFDHYRFRAVASYPFYLEKAEGKPVIRIVARERPGFFVPVEEKPMLDISAPFGFGVTPMTGVTHGTEVTVVR